MGQIGLQVFCSNVFLAKPQKMIRNGHTVSGQKFQTLDNFTSNGPQISKLFSLSKQFRRVDKRNQPPQHDTVGGRNPAPLYLHPKTNPRTPSLTLGQCLVVRKKEVE